MVSREAHPKIRNGKKAMITNLEMSKKVFEFNTLLPQSYLNNYQDKLNLGL